MIEDDAAYYITLAAMGDSEATYHIAVAAEDWGHFCVVTRLADRVLMEAVPWCVDILESLRRWTGREGRPWDKIGQAYREARALGLPVYGHFNGEPGSDDAAMVRAQLLLFKVAKEDGMKIDAVVLARDGDNYSERAEGFEQALEYDWPFPVVVALCSPEGEAWRIAGFDPEDEAEQLRLEKECKALGFAPNREPHRLNSKHKDDPKDAKAILRRLSGGDREREQRCLEAPLVRLRERGWGCGLVAFLEDVHRRLVPMIAGTDSRRN